MNTDKYEDKSSQLGKAFGKYLKLLGPQPTEASRSISKSKTSNGVFQKSSLTPRTDKPPVDLEKYQRVQYCSTCLSNSSIKKLKQENLSLKKILSEREIEISALQAAVRAKDKAINSVKIQNSDLRSRLVFFENDFQSENKNLDLSTFGFHKKIEQLQSELTSINEDVRVYSEHIALAVHRLESSIIALGKLQDYRVFQLPYYISYKDRFEFILNQVNGATQRINDIYAENCESCWLQ